MNVFGENLQFYRKKREMTQEQLAEQLDVSRHGGVIIGLN